MGDTANGSLKGSFFALCPKACPPHLSVNRRLIRDCVRPHRDCVQPHRDPVRPHRDCVRPHRDPVRPHRDPVRRLQSFAKIHDPGIYPRFIRDLSAIYPEFIRDLSGIYPGFIWYLSGIYLGFIRDLIFTSRKGRVY